MDYKKTNRAYLIYLAMQYKIIQKYRSNKDDLNLKFLANIAIIPIAFALDNTNITLNDIKRIPQKEIDKYDYESKKLKDKFIFDKK